MQLADMIYCITEHFPKQQQYILVSQMQRSALSMPSNIAEGHSRGSRKDYRQFVIMARGSLSELKTQSYLSAKRKFISKKELDSIVSCTSSIGAKLNALIKALGKDPGNQTPNT